MVSLILNKFKYINFTNKYLTMYADDSNIILQTGVILRYSKLQENGEKLGVAGCWNLSFITQKACFLASQSTK